MRNRRQASRSSRSRPQIRYASERRGSERRQRRPQRSRSFRLSKDTLFNFYVVVLLGPLFLVLAGFVAFFAHDVALPAMFAFVTNSAIDGISRMWTRPTLIIAFLFVLSVLWCISDGNTTGSSSNFRRGRDVGGLDRAQQRTRDHSLKSRRSQSPRRR